MQHFLQVEFELPEEFIKQYRDGNDKFGFNGVGLITFLRSYALPKDDGSMECWRDCCQRVTESTYAIQKWWCKNNDRPWSDNKALRSAKEFFDRMYTMKWLPAGRGMAVMGTSLINDVKAVEAINNCGFISTKNFNSHTIEWYMTMLMLGVGVGYDTEVIHDNIILYEPYVREEYKDKPYIISDSREGWAKSVAHLVNMYIGKEEHRYFFSKGFDYSRIRPKGAMISTFQRPASGPEPLKLLHEQITNLCNKYVGRIIDSRFIVDLFNMIAVSVVSGSQRRSATIALGEYGDNQFYNLKDLECNPERAEWAWTSNNSIILDKYLDFYDNEIDNLYQNGENCFVWRNNFSKGRIDESSNDTSIGINP